MSKHSVQLRHVASWKLFTIVGVIFLIAVLLLMFRGQAEKGSVEILQDGKIIKTLSKSELEHDTSFQISYGEHYNIVQIKDGKIRIKEADCPDQTCVRMGELSEKGSIICLPHRLEIRFQKKAGSEDELDGVAR